MFLRRVYWKRLWSKSCAMLAIPRLINNSPAHGFKVVWCGSQFQYTRFETHDRLPGFFYLVENATIFRTEWQTTEGKNGVGRNTTLRTEFCNCIDYKATIIPQESCVLAAYSPMRLFWLKSMMMMMLECQYSNYHFQCLCCPVCLFSNLCLFTSTAMSAHQWLWIFSDVWLALCGSLHVALTKTWDDFKIKLHVHIEQWLAGTLNATSNCA